MIASCAYVFVIPALSLAASAEGARGAAATPPGRAEEIPPDRGSDPDLIARLDFESALKEGTANALCLFIRHHAGHPLEARARQLLWERYQTDGSRDHPCPETNK